MVLSEKLALNNVTLSRLETLSFGITKSLPFTTHITFTTTTKNQTTLKNVLKIDKFSLPKHFIEESAIEEIHRTYKIFVL